MAALSLEKVRELLGTTDIPGSEKELLVLCSRMGELLVARGKLAPFELYKHMQANLAHRILDAFRWSGASWRLLDEAEPAEHALRAHPAQLVLTGCAGSLSSVVCRKSGKSTCWRETSSASVWHQNGKSN